MKKNILLLVVILFPLFLNGGVNPNTFKYDNVSKKTNTSTFRFKNKLYAIGLNINGKERDGNYFRELVVYEIKSNSEIISTKDFELHSILDYEYYLKDTIVGTTKTYVNLDFLCYRIKKSNEIITSWLPIIEPEILNDGFIKLGFYSTINDLNYEDGYNFYVFETFIILEYNKYKDLFILRGMWYEREFYFIEDRTSQDKHIVKQIK